MESNIFYQLAQAMSRKGEDLEQVASEMAKAINQIIREEGKINPNLPYEKEVIDEFVRLANM